eukprot:642632-Alexandrium_andersonii.AAC.1
MWTSGCSATSFGRTPRRITARASSSTRASSWRMASPRTSTLRRWALHACAMARAGARLQSSTA